MKWLQCRKMDWGSCSFSLNRLSFRILNLSGLYLKIQFLWVKLDYIGLEKITSFLLKRPPALSCSRKFPKKSFFPIPTIIKMLIKSKK